MRVTEATRTELIRTNFTAAERRREEKFKSRRAAYNQDIKARTFRSTQIYRISQIRTQGRPMTHAQTRSKIILVIKRRIRTELDKGLLEIHKLTRTLSKLVKNRKNLITSRRWEIGVEPREIEIPRIKLRRSA